jgi:hypothetical protein
MLQLHLSAAFQPIQDRYELCRDRHNDFSLLRSSFLPSAQLMRPAFRSRERPFGRFAEPCPDFSADRSRGGL